MMRKFLLLMVFFLSIPLMFAQVECPDGSVAETNEKCSIEEKERISDPDTDADGMPDIELRRDGDADGDGISDAESSCGERCEEGVSVSRTSSTEFEVSLQKEDVRVDLSSLECPEDKCGVEITVKNSKPVALSFSGDLKGSLSLVEGNVLVSIPESICSQKGDDVICGNLVALDVKCDADIKCETQSGAVVIFDTGDCDDRGCPVRPVNDMPRSVDSNISNVKEIDKSSPSAKGDKISLVGFGSFSVSKVASPIYTSETTEGVSPLYEPETALQITGGGAGRVSLTKLKEVTCPNDKCSSVAVEVMNTSPVALFFEPEFATQENVFSLKDEVVNLGIANSVCSQKQNEIHCTNENDNVLVVAFDKESEVVCEVEDEGQVYSWGHRAATDDEGKVYSWGYSTTKDENNIYAWGSSRSAEKQTTDGEGNVYCWGENKEGLRTDVEFTSFSISKRSARTGRFNADLSGNVSSNQTTRDFDTIDNAPEEKERGVSSKPDSKKALDGFIRSINTIQSSLERCESDVCRQVSANADKRVGLVTQAKQNSDNATRYIKEVQSIVHEDIASLERCETDICREVLSQEKQLLASINDYLDVDDDGDGISRGIKFLTNTTDSRGETVSSVKRARPSEWSQEDKDEIRKYIQNRTNLTREDLALSIAYQNSDNERVREVRYNEETQDVEIDHVEQVKLFGFISVDAQAKTRVSQNGTQETDYPWWSFLALKQRPDMLVSEWDE